MYGVCQALHIAGRDAGHAYATIARQIHWKFIAQAIHLLRICNAQKKWKEEKKIKQIFD